MKSKKLIIIIAVVLGVCLLGYVATRNASHDEHEGHDHSGTSGNHGEPQAHAEHEGHDEDEGHAGHEGEDVTTKDAHAIMETEHEPHDTELVVQLSKEDAKRFGIEVGTAGAGKLDVYITVPGEITFNTNKLAHLVPTVSGIVRQVTGNIGDTVTAGEILTWIESTEVGGAKLDYLSKLSEMSCCSIELTRVQEIHDNTLKMLEILKDSPSLEALLKTSDSAMGMNRSRLISSYSEFIFARETHLREKDLYEKKITSKDDFLRAQLAFKKTDAEYIATKDSIAFEIKRDLLEAKQTRQILELQVQAAERLLYLHGLTAKDVKDLSALAKNQNFLAKAKEEEEECDDPNCKGCQAEAAAKRQESGVADIWTANEKLAWYPIRSPFNGTIIEKHIVLGELVGTDSAVYSVADLSSVWIDLQIHQKNIDMVRKGQKVVISSKSSVPKTKGIIDYVEPVIDKKTRTSLARVILDNTSRRFRPGTFITAEILVENRNAKMVVSKDTLQDVDDTTCVFVQSDHGFEARPVTVGWSNKSKVEIISGLRAGEKVVTKNSFRLKAELEKAVGGGHAGHGH
ncbi:MAG TPA: efflux RND transporter periplasmic adaptor subunit [Phycisphaerales bacterium]|nr:efflux RND transporter periplasmic adaptor subunit [Phycisphaerales bacterium]